MFPEAHFNFAVRFLAVYWGFVFLTNMKHVLLNDNPPFMVLSLFFFPFCTSFFSLPLCPQAFYLMHHSFQLTAFF